MIGKIKANDKTAGHVANLRQLGYEAEKVGEEIVVTNVSEFVEGEVPFETSEERNALLKDVIANKKAFTYGTKFIIGKDDDGDKVVRFGFMALAVLGDASCLMMKKSKKGKKKSGGIDIDALKALAS